MRQRRPQLVADVVDELGPDLLEPAQLGDVLEQDDDRRRPVAARARRRASGLAVADPVAPRGRGAAPGTPRTSGLDPGVEERLHHAPPGEPARRDCRAARRPRSFAARSGGSRRAAAAPRGAGRPPGPAPRPAAQAATARRGSTSVRRSASRSAARRRSATRAAASASARPTTAMTRMPSTAASIAHADASPRIAARPGPPRAGDRRASGAPDARARPAARPPLSGPGARPAGRRPRSRRGQRRVRRRRHGANSRRVRRAARTRGAARPRGPARASRPRAARPAAGARSTPSTGIAPATSARRQLRGDPQRLVLVGIHAARPWTLVARRSPGRSHEAAQRLAGRAARTWSRQSRDLRGRLARGAAGPSTPPRRAAAGPAFGRGTARPACSSRNAAQDQLRRHGQQPLAHAGLGPARRGHAPDDLRPRPLRTPRGRRA